MNTPRVSTRELSPALVIGTGLVGASVAHALTRAGLTVHLQDKVSSHARVAASRGAGTTEAPDPKAVRLVVVAVPPEALAKVIAKTLQTYPNATVTDVGSVKGTVLAALRRTDADLSRYVGSHPMAGSQHVGPLTANADLFIDRTWVITPHDTSAAHAVLDVQEVAALCGARRITMGAAHHDEAVAQVSHLPHLVSVLVAGSLTRVPAEHLRLAGQGLRDVTRIAGSDPDLWQQIIGANSAAVRTELVAIQADLAEMIATLDAGRISEVLERGRRGHPCAARQARPERRQLGARRRRDPGRPGCARPPVPRHRGGRRQRRGPVHRPRPRARGGLAVGAGGPWQGRRTRRSHDRCRLDRARPRTATVGGTCLPTAW